MDDVETRASDAGLRCGQCGALLQVRVPEGGVAPVATCSDCRSVYDLEGLVCAPTEIDALNDDVALGIRQAFE